MTLDALIMLAGFLVAVLPFLGFPIQWDNAILVILGIAVIALGIFVRRRGLARRSVIPPVNGVTFEKAPHDGEPR